jgi:hypothetical protein
MSKVSLEQLENYIHESSIEIGTEIKKMPMPFWKCKKNGQKNCVEKNEEVSNPSASFELLKDFIEENSAPNGKTTWQICLYNRQTANPDDKDTYAPHIGQNRVKTNEVTYIHEPEKKQEQFNNNQDSKYWQQKCDRLENKIESLNDKIQDLKVKELEYKHEIQKLKTDISGLEAELNEVEEVEETETIAGLPKEMVQNAVMGILGLTQKQNSTQPINGIEVEGTENKTEKLKTILQRIKAVDRNYVENLEVLAKFMEQQPKQYFAILPTMKGLTV